MRSSNIKPHEGRSRTPSAKAIGHLLGLAWKQRGTFLLATAALLIGSGINLAFPELIRHYLNNEGIAALADHRWEIAGLLIALFAVQGLAFHARAYLFNLVGQRAVADVRARLAENLLRFPIEFFDRNRVGDLVSRVSADAQQVQEAVSLRLSVILRYSLQVIAGVVLMSFISLRLTAVLILGVPVLVGAAFFLGRALKKISKAQQEALGTLTTVLEESLSGIRTVRASGAEASTAKRLYQVNSQVLELGVQRGKVSAFFASFVNFLMNTFIVVVIVYGLSLVSTAGMPVGDLTAFFLFAAIVAVSFAFVVGAYAEFTQAAGASERVFEIIAQPTHHSGLSSRVIPAPDIKFESVNFAYPSRPGQPVLQDLSFTAHAARMTALVGPSGSGKSSVVALILGFYAPQSGRITTHGEPLTGSLLHDLRAVTGYVPQDPWLFGGSLADNLLFGVPNKDEAALWSILEGLNLAPLIKGLPAGLETPVGDRGLQLSGGQRQRIAIARALLRKPEFLILDEATSALDSENEAAVMETIRREMARKTILIVAHRLSTIQHADKIVVLEHGKVVQEGTHAGLASSAGLYRLLVERQELT